MRTIVAIAGLLTLSVAPFVMAQESETAAEAQAAAAEAAEETMVPAGPEPLTAEVAADFDERLLLVLEKRDEVDRIDAQLEGLEGLRARILGARLDNAIADWFQTTIELAHDVATQLEQGRDVSAFRDPLVEELRTIPAVGDSIIDRLRENVVFPDKDMSPAEAVVADQDLLRIIRDLDSVYAALLTYIEMAESFGYEQEQLRQSLEQEFRDTSANRSIFLQLALDSVVVLKSAVATMPSDTELPKELNAAQARVSVASQALQSVVDLMNRHGMPTRQFRQQLLTATGELTTDVLDVGLVAGLVRDWSKAALEYTKTQGPRLLFRVLLVVLILVGFAYLSVLVRKGLTRAMKSSKVTLSHLLKAMIVSTAKNLVFLIGLLFALSQLGISIGPLLAGLGIAGFIIGFALQDTLSNFASGLMILVYRPFDVGDFVDAGGVRGRVDRMSLVNTTFKTLDNQVIIVPNNMIWQQVITNITAQRTRRVDLTFGISYSDDIDKAKEILWDVVRNYDGILEEPEPNIRVNALGESSVDLICRPWVRTDDYWDTYWNLTEIVKKRFDEEGITIPFPQRDVHHFHPQES
jgi:small conductance mechanosensitive channel